MKQIAEVATNRLSAGESLSTAIPEIGSAGRACLLATGSVEGFSGLCFAQQGCCTPQGISNELITTHSVGTTRARNPGQQE